MCVLPRRGTGTGTGTVLSAPPRARPRTTHPSPPRARPSPRVVCAALDPKYISEGSDSYHAIPVVGGFLLLLAIPVVGGRTPDVGITSLPCPPCSCTNKHSKPKRTREEPAGYFSVTSMLELRPHCGTLPECRGSYNHKCILYLGQTRLKHGCSVQSSEGTQLPYRRRTAGHSTHILSNRADRCVKPQRSSERTTHW